MLSRLRSDEGGFTLIETLMACVVGIVILAAAGGLLQMAARSQRLTSERVSATQRGRLVMDQMTRQLRSQTCLGSGKPSLASGTGDEVVFYGSLNPTPTTSGQLQIDERTLRFEPLAGDPTTGRIVQVVRPGVGKPPSVDFTTKPAVTTVLIDRVSRTAPGQPIFTYWKYDKDFSPQMLPVAVPASLADRELTVRVDIAFHSYPDGGGTKLRTPFFDQAFVRTADPTDPEHSPKCI